MRASSVLPLLLLAACSQEDDPQPVAPVETVLPETATLAEVATLEGEWRVAGIDGQPLDETYGIALSASADQVWWEPPCAGMVRTYKIEGQRFSTDPAASAVPPPEHGAPPRPVCAIGLPPRLVDVIVALDEADTIGRTLANGVAISGPGHSLLLFSQ